MEPKLIKAFEKQYGVKVRESNFDSMQGMMAKLRSGNRYDVIFPTAEWVDRLRKANQLMRFDVEQIPNASSVYRLLRSALVRPRGRPHGPVRDVRQRDHLPRRQDQRHDGLVERHGQPVGRRARLPARRLPGGDRRRQPRQRRRPELGRRGRRREGQGVGARPEAEDARLLDRRHPEHGLRQRVDPPRLERRRGERPQPGRHSRRTSRSRSAPRASRSAATASPSPPTPSTPARRSRSSTSSSRPRTRRRTSSTWATRCRTPGPTRRSPPS